MAIYVELTSRIAVASFERALRSTGTLRVWPISAWRALYNSSTRASACTEMVARYSPLMRAILFVFALSSSPSQAAERLFTGKWAPVCQPTAAQEIKNELATVFIGPNWVQVVDMMCNFKVWSKAGSSYSTSLDCHTEGFGDFKNKITVTPTVDKLRIRMTTGKFDELTKRCGDEWAGGKR